VLDHLWEVADHTHCAGVISAVEELVQSQETKLHTSVYKVDILNILCDINLFSLYLMNSVFHTMLDAASKLF